MTEDQLFAIVDANELSERRKIELKAAVRVYAKALLQQTPCTASLEFLRSEMIKEKQLAAQERIEMEYHKHIRNCEHLQFVIQLIKDSQPMT